MFEERRRHERARQYFPAVFIPTSDIGIQCKCESRDISEGGMRFISTREPVCGYDVEINMTLPDSKDTLTIQSEVVWSNPLHEPKGHFEFGIKYSSLSYYNKQILQKYTSEA